MATRSEKKTTTKSASASSGKEIDFEKALSNLETLVTKMESGDLSLEESLRAFEEGVKLTRDCQSRLASAEQRVKVLMEQQGELVEADFDEGDLNE
ncbi:MAG: exodeoxyribonuclease VII small subunit [Cellvibrionaceae bacterium]